MGIEAVIGGGGGRAGVTVKRWGRRRVLERGRREGRCDCEEVGKEEGIGEGGGEEKTGVIVKRWGRRRVLEREGGEEDRCDCEEVGKEESIGEG